MNDNEPKTQAGRALLAEPTVLLMMETAASGGEILGINEGELELHILTIEAEAAAAPAALPRWWDSVVRRAVYSGNNDEMTVRQLRQKLAAENPSKSEPAAAEPPLYCGRCGHPMHWKQCDRDYLDGRCECRNDGERAAQPPSCPECGARYGD